ncbi:Protein C18B12.4, partial [Aphelenchoides avenae]
PPSASCFPIPVIMRRRPFTTVVLLLLLPVSYAQFFIERLYISSLGETTSLRSCNATGANFGPDVAHLANKESIGCIQLTQPHDACSQAFHAQSSSYDALIVANYPGPPIPIAGGRFADQVRIPVLMVSRACMDDLVGNSTENMQHQFKLGASPKYYEAIRPKFSTAIKRYATHLVAVGLIFLLFSALLNTGSTVAVDGGASVLYL